MRSLLIASAALFIAGSLPAAAADYPWCQRTRNTGGSPQCSFTTLRQCQDTIRGIGGDCVQNPMLAYGQYRGRRDAPRHSWDRDRW